MGGTWQGAAAAAWRAAAEAAAWAAADRALDAVDHETEALEAAEDAWNARVGALAMTREGFMVMARAVDRNGTVYPTMAGHAVGHLKEAAGHERARIEAGGLQRAAHARAAALDHARAAEAWRAAAASYARAASAAGAVGTGTKGAARGRRKRTSALAESAELAAAGHERAAAEANRAADACDALAIGARGTAVAAVREIDSLGAWASGRHGLEYGGDRAAWKGRWMAASAKAEAARKKAEGRQAAAKAATVRAERAAELADGEAERRFAAYVREEERAARECVAAASAAGDGPDAIVLWLKRAGRAEAARTAGDALAAASVWAEAAEEAERRAAAESGGPQSGRRG